MAKFLRDNATLLALIALGVFLTFYNEHFFTARNLSNVALQVTIIGVIAVGMTMVILIAGIDLSVGSLVGLTAVLVTWLMHKQDIGVFPAIALTLVIGAGIGLWNGFWVARYKIPSFIITLGMMTIARGLALRISDKSSIPVTKSGFSAIGGEYISPTVSIALLIILWAAFVGRAAYDSYQRRKYGLEVNLVEKATEILISSAGFGLALYIFGGYRGIPYAVAILAVVAVAGSFVLQNTKFGRRLYAMGGNEEAARLSGINIRATTMLVFVVTAVLSALAGIILASRLDGANPNLGTMLELDVITAVVIGGTSLAGGLGTIGGSMIGVFFIGVLSNGMSLENIDQDYQFIVKGLIIIVAVWFDVVSKKKR